MVGTASLGAFGYLANDLSDVAVDKTAGKGRESHQWSRRVVGAVCAGSAVLSVVSYWLARRSPSTLLLALAAVGVAAGYSIRPLRLKERHIAGVLVAATAQRAMPGLVGAAIFHAATPAFWLVLAAISLQGVRYILLHQLADASHDLRTGVRTFVARVGTPVVLRMLDSLPVIEVLLLGVSMSVRPISSPWLSLLFLPSLARQLRRVTSTPVVAAANRRFKTAHLRTTYYLLLPAVTVGVLVSRDPTLYMPLAIIEVSWRWRVWRAMISQPLGSARWKPWRQRPPAARW
jgi:4-hydroxybenzoate polyprenyltransferase